MSVLPSSATLWSFFVVVVVVAFLLGTALIAISMKPALSRLRAKLQSDPDKEHPMPRTPLWLRVVLDGIRTVYRITGLADYVRKHINLVAPQRDDEKAFKWSDVFKEGPKMDPFGFILTFPLLQLLFLPAAHVAQRPCLVCEALTREVLFLRDQCNLYRFLEHGYDNVRWSRLALVRDVFRVLFLPVWCALIVAIVGLLVAQDIVFGVVMVLTWPVRCCAGQKEDSAQETELKNGARRQDILFSI